MSAKKRRKLYVAGRVSDGIVASLENMEFLGDLTRREVNFWYARLAHSAGLLDLYPRRISTPPPAAELKEAIKDRLGNGDHAREIPFPDTKEKKEPGNAFEKAFNRRSK